MYNNTMKTMIKNQIIPIIILKFIHENDICYDKKTKSIRETMCTIPSHIIHS